MDEFFSEADRDNKEVVLKVATIDGWGIQYASKRLRDDREVVLAAVKQDGWVLKFASDRLKDDKDVVLSAVKSEGTSIKFASSRLKKDVDVIKAACKQDSLAFNYVDKKVQSDRELMMEIISENPSAQFLSGKSGVSSSEVRAIIRQRESLLESDIDHLQKTLKGLSGNYEELNNSIHSSLFGSVKTEIVLKEEKLPTAKTTPLDKVKEDAKAEDRKMAVEKMKAEMIQKTQKNGSGLSI